MINPFFLLLIAVPTSMLIIPLAWRLAPYLGMVDKPDPRKVHKTPIPRVGGWGITAGSVVPCVVALHGEPFIQSFLLGALVLFGFGLWDDARQISHWKKFGGQMLACGLVVYHGGIYVTNWPFLGDLMPTEVAKAATVVALMGMVNAINHSDGLDGLAGGESILSLISIAYMAHVAGSDLGVAIAFAVIGGVLGFLRYNTHPAEVFMGDAGSQFLGFALGMLAIYLSQVALPAMSPALPLLFLGLPISDILVVLYKRISGGMNWFKATRNHLHHRLLDLGFDHYETVILIYSVQALLVTLAVLMRFQSDLLVAGTYLSIIAAVFGAVGVAEMRGWRRRTLGLSWAAELVDLLRHNARVKRLPLLVVSVLLPVFMIGGASWATQVPRDFGVVSGVLAVVVLVELLMRREQGSLLNRLAIYVAVVFSAYLFVRFGSAREDFWQVVTLGLLAVLAVALGLFIRYTSEHRFGVTPTDYLIGFGVLALIVFGGIDVRARHAVETIMYTVVMLYACEAMLGVGKSRWTLLSITAAVCFASLAWRGLMV